MILLDEFRGEIMSQPIWMGGELFPPVDVEAGDRFRCTPSKFLLLLEDLACLSSRVLLEDVVFDEEYLEAYKRRIYGGGGKDMCLLKDYTVLVVPSWYHSVAVLHYPDTGLPDPMETLSRVTSLSVG
jgi:hypothetical protein